MTELTATLQAAIAAHMTPDLVTQAVEKHMNEMIQRSIEDAVGRFSENGKVIKAAIEKSMKIDRLDLPMYSERVCQILTAQIDEIVSDTLAGKLKSDMAEILSIAPKSIKLSEIVQSMKERCYDWEESWDADFVTCCVSPAYEGSDSVVVKLHPEELRNDYGHDFRMHISESGSILSLTISGTEVRAARQRASAGAEHYGIVYGIERDLRAYYAAGTIIEVDQHNVDTSGKNYQ